MKNKILLLVCIFLLFPMLSWATERHALVIGNGDYLYGSLDNPGNDASAVAEQLKSLGYEIHGGGPSLDLDQTGMRRTLRAFSQSIPDGAQVVFYYAGHGMATRTENYLIPVREDIQVEEDLQDSAVDLRNVVERLKSANPSGVNIVLLDACRDNPLGRSYRSARRGLVELKNTPRGVFISYAASSGQVAEDGTGEPHGTYTGELLKVMQEKPGVLIEIAHKEISGRVVDKTNGAQFPVSEGTLYGNWCFGTCGEDAALITTTEKTQSSPVIEPSNNRWLIIGGAVLGVVAAGYLLQDDPSDPGGSNGNFTLELTPPE